MGRDRKGMENGTKNNRLERRAMDNNVNAESPLSMTQKIKNSLKNYAVDTTSAWLFYNPIMASAEYFAAGMEPEEVLKSRLFASAVHAAVFRPLGKFRKYMAKKLNVTSESPAYKKFLSDTLATIIIQAPAYSTVLYLAGASTEEMAVALPTVLGIGAVSGRPYGYFSDKWRNFWDLEPVFKKKKEK